LNRGLLKVQAQESANNLIACLSAPESFYRGQENQLYRVEIHQGCDPINADLPDPKNMEDFPTFKWSRENGSVLFPIQELTGTNVILKHLGRDDRFKLTVGDWVEIVDDDLALSEMPCPMAQVAAINREQLSITLLPQQTTKLPSYNHDDAVKKHAYLRRWDHKAKPGQEDLWIDGALKINVRENQWVELENGINIQFQPAPAGTRYRSGDYWLIPARTATGDVEWPKDINGAPMALPPHGVEHHYAPLAIIVNGTATDLRCQLSLKGSGLECGPPQS
jgi:Family of unknown function (DUF6519)